MSTPTSAPGQCSQCGLCHSLPVRTAVPSSRQAPTLVHLSAPGSQLAFSECIISEAPVRQWGTWSQFLPGHAVINEPGIHVVDPLQMFSKWCRSCCQDRRNGGRGRVNNSQSQSSWVQWLRRDPGPPALWAHCLYELHVQAASKLQVP